MHGFIAPILGLGLLFTTPAPVVSYDFSGTFVTQGTVHNGEVMTHGGKVYRAESVVREGTVTLFRTVPKLGGTGEVTFYPR